MEKSYGIIIFHLNSPDQITKVLLIQAKDTNSWTFPKGQAENGESAQETAIREIEEEVGLRQLQLLPEVIFKNSYTYQTDFGLITKEVTYFIGLANTTEVVLQSSEVIDYKWIHYNEVIAELTYTNEGEMFTKIINYIQKIDNNIFKI